MGLHLQVSNSNTFRHRQVFKFCFCYSSRAPSTLNIFFSPKNALFPNNRFSTHFFSMKMAELGENVLVSCIIDFDDIQL